MIRALALTLGALTAAVTAVWLLGKLDRPLAKLEREPWMFV